MAWQSLYDWCIENGEWGEQLLYEFGNGNNKQIYENEFGMMQAPQDYARGSRTKIKWTCRNNSSHVWEAPIRNRTILGSNCPYCTNKKASEENNLLEWCKQNGDWGQRIINEWTGLNENNEHVEMTEFTKGSAKKVLWKCSKNHTWCASLHDRTSSRYGCPICANMLIVEGINDLRTYCLENENCKYLLDEWTGIDENGRAIKMSEVAVGSNKKVKWHCTKCLSDWTASIVRRTMDGNGCPVCAGQVIVEGINDLKTWCLNNPEYKHLLDEWTGIDENGNSIKMTEVSKGTAKKVLWRCHEGHAWYARINDRTSKHRSMCPKCMALSHSKIMSDAKTKAGENDLLTWCNENGEYGEKIKTEFMSLDEFGNKIEITQVAKGSGKKVLWHCTDCNNEWYATVDSRTSSKQGCAKCARLRLNKLKATPIDGVNDLKSWCDANGKYGEKIKQEWLGEDEDGNKIEMEQVIVGSAKKVKWRCTKCLREWTTELRDRTTHNKYGCPFCSKAGTSYPEQFLYRSLKQLYPQTINRGKYNGYEYDIAIPEERLCIEYSPTYWHDSKVERDEEKLNLCEKHDVRFIYIREDYKDKYEHCFEEDYICYKASNNKEEHNKQLTEILQHILNSLGHNISEINIEKAQTEAFNFMHDIEESDDEEELEDF